jgi:YidC/Oxa1 family membrane protein insertase
MFLQMPIWIALYTALQSTFELRQAPFLHFFGVPFTWIYDLSQPDHLIQFSKPVTFFFLHLSGLNVLPILLGGVFWLQNKYTPKPPATTPEQIQQQKMMQWMTLLFPVFLYSGPSGLNLYILTSTTIGIIESKIIRKHLKEQEEAENAGKVIVDAPVTRGSKQAHRNTPAPQPKAGGIGGWFASLQQKAEEIQREVERRKKDQERS